MEKVIGIAFINPGQIIPSTDLIKLIQECAHYRLLIKQSFKLKKNRKKAQEMLIYQVGVRCQSRPIGTESFGHVMCSPGQW